MIKNSKQQGVPVGTIAAGALLGSAALLTLRNKKARKKIHDAVNIIKEKGTNAYNELQEDTKNYLMNQNLAAVKGGKAIR